MKIWMAWIGLMVGVGSLSAEETVTGGREMIVLSGGPAMRYFERDKASSHDKYWGNFIDASKLRLTQLKKEAAATDTVTWLVYRPGYKTRGEEMHEDLLGDIMASSKKLGVALLWFDTKEQVINYLNRGQNRKLRPIGNFDYFGHSNKACFLFDYSNEFDSMSVQFLHANDLRKVDRDIFARNATCKSWGCHSGELYSERWKSIFGVPMEGAIGKTDYSNGGLPILSSEGGKWAQ